MFVEIIGHRQGWQDVPSGAAGDKEHFHKLWKSGILENCAIQ